MPKYSQLNVVVKSLIYMSLRFKKNLKHFPPFLYYPIFLLI